MQNKSPKPIIKAIRAIVLHTFGVQVRSRVWGLRFKVNGEMLLCLGTEVWVWGLNYRLFKQGSETS